MEYAVEMNRLIELQMLMSHGIREDEASKLLLDDRLDEPVGSYPSHRY